MSSTDWHLRTSTSGSVNERGLDLATTNDVALLKQEIMHLRRKTELLMEEKAKLVSILGMEKEFVKDRQNKLESWEHFARTVLFKVYSNR